MGNVNVTITMDNKLLHSSKILAAKRHKSLSGLIREYLQTATGNVATVDLGKDPETTLLIYSLGQLDRKDVMKSLDIDYGTLIRMLADRGLSLPRVSDEEADRMAEEFVLVSKSERV